MMSPSESRPDYSPSSAVKKKHLLSETTGNDGTPAFPWRLHDMLGAAAREGFENIVSWQPCGLAFKVNDTLIFTESILPRHFKTTIFKSFQRQLNIYGFRRLTSGSQKGAYTHKFLIRGKPEVCQFMVRTKIKERGSRPKKLGSRSISKLAAQSGCGEEQIYPKRTGSHPATETIRMTANISAASDGAPNQEFRLLSSSSVKVAFNHGLFNKLLDGHAKSKHEGAEDPREKFAPWLFQRPSIDYTHPTSATTDSSEIEFDPSSSQNHDNSYSDISRETTGESMDVWDPDRIFKEPSEDNVTFSSPRREQDLVDFPIAADIADEIINMFS